LRVVISAEGQTSKVATGPSLFFGAVAHPEINTNPTHTITATIIPENKELNLDLSILPPPFFLFQIPLIESFLKP
jgi:hypothetical protein